MDDVSTSDVTDSEQENPTVPSFMGIVDVLCSISDYMDEIVAQKKIAEFDNEAFDMESAPIGVLMLKPSEMMFHVDEVSEDIRKKD